MSVLRSPKHEVLELQACHPRFFATHRYIVYAKLVSVLPRGGVPYPVEAAATARRLVEPDPRDARAGSELAVAAGHVHERIRRRRSSDHVRLLARQRLEHDAVLVQA